MDLIFLQPKPPIRIAVDGVEQSTSYVEIASPRVDQRDILADRLKTMQSLRKQGMTLQQIATLHGISAPRVSVILRKASGLKPSSRDAV